MDAQDAIVGIVQDELRVLEVDTDRAVFAL